MNLKFKSVLITLFVGVFAMLSSGCIVTGARRLAGFPTQVPAGIDVTNNVSDTVMTIESSRSGDMGVSVETGQTYRIPISGIPVGGYYTVRAKFYDLSGRYLGTAEQSFSIYFDYSGRYSQSWVVNYYQEPTQRTRR